MEVSPKMFMPAKVLHEDKDFLTLEVGKHDEVTFNLEEDDQFYTVLFIHVEDGVGKVWKPWEEE